MYPFVESLSPYRILDSLNRNLKHGRGRSLDPKDATQLRRISFDKCKATGYNPWVKIRNFTHKGLERLYTDDSSKGIPPDPVDKLREDVRFPRCDENPGNCGHR